MAIDEPAAAFRLQESQSEMTIPQGDSDPQICAAPEFGRWERDLAAEKEAWRQAMEQAHASAAWLMQRALELDDPRHTPTAPSLS